MVQLANHNHAYLVSNLLSLSFFFPWSSRKSRWVAWSTLFSSLWLQGWRYHYKTHDLSPLPLEFKREQWCWMVKAFGSLWLQGWQYHTTHHHAPIVSAPWPIPSQKPTRLFIRAKNKMKEEK